MKNRILADTEPWRERLGGEVEARLNSLVVAELLRERDALLNYQDASAPPGFWDEIMQTWRQQVLEPRLEAEKNSCAAGRLVMEMLLGILGGAGMPKLPNIPGLSQLPGGGGQSQDNGSTFLAKEWAVRGGDLFASKQWDLTVSGVTTGEENGTFKLDHKPQ
jgi:hypothetical protein